ncbi:MAG: YidC/Oxa1 family membrane protein insertase [Patescibacteria group bacterium]
MNILYFVFNEFFFRPLLNGLVFLYDVVPPYDFGVAIILLTLLIRMALYPLTKKTIESQKAIAVIQPHLAEIKERHKGDKEKEVKETMELYKKHKVNPMSGCLPILIQLPILIALFRVFQKVLDPQALNGLYFFVANPGAIDPMFLGLIDLSKRNIVFAALAGLAQYWQSKLTVQFGASPNNSAPPAFGKEMAKAMNIQMLYFMPILTFVMSLSFPAGLSLYWFVTTMFSVLQQYLIMKKLTTDNSQLTTKIINTDNK